MSIGVLDVIDRLPGELADRLAADDFFVDIPIVVAEEGNIAAMMAAKQAAVTAKSGKRGVAVIVLQIVADDDEKELAFGPLTLHPAFQVVEIVELNRDANGTGKSARRVARRIRDVIKPLQLYGLTTEFVTDKPCIEPVNLGKELGANVQAYQVSFHTWECDNETVTLAAMPTITAVGNPATQFSLSSVTAGADIWFTTDDSFPSPTRVGQPGVQQWRGDPIDVPAGGYIVRAAAYKTGMIASQVARATITTIPV